MVEISLNQTNFLVKATVSPEKKSIENFSYKRVVSIIAHCQSLILNFMLTNS